VRGEGGGGGQADVAEAKDTNFGEIQVDSGSGIILYWARTCRGQGFHRCLSKYEVGFFSKSHGCCLCLAQSN
jgi:hypothetical protein